MFYLIMSKAAVAEMKKDGSHNFDQCRCAEPSTACLCDDEGCMSGATIAVTGGKPML
jgi:hypothetical protein